MPSRSGPLAPGYAFVTGGARGLGNAVAVAYAKEGSKGVAIIDIQDAATMEEGKKKVEEHGCSCIAIRADVTKEEQVENAVAEATAKFGRIDYAANFAGVLGGHSTIVDDSLEAFRKVMDVNTTGVWLCTKYELKQMMKQTSIEVEPGRVPQLGSIVNCASVNSLQAGAGCGSYTASKHACLGITKTTPFLLAASTKHAKAALEARQHNIRVNSVSPGFLLTKMITSLANEIAGGLGESVWGTYEARQGRSAQFEEVGDVVVLLSTPRMSLVNGHNLFIDGGFTINENPS